MENGKAKREAARLLGRLSARAATPEQRKDRATAGGKAAQKKLTKAERSRRAKLRWQRWRENKAKRGQPVADGTTTMEAPESRVTVLVRGAFGEKEFKAEMDIPESMLRYEANKEVEP